MTQPLDEEKKQKKDRRGGVEERGRLMHDDDGSR